MAATAYQVAERSRLDIPGINDAARMIPLGRANVSTLENANVFYEDFLVANAGILTAFDFNLLQGDRRTALKAPFSVIVTEETAKKLLWNNRCFGKGY